MKKILLICFCVNFALAQNTSLRENWENEAWKNVSLQSTNYGMDGQIEQDLLQIWNDVIDVWVNQTQTLHTFPIQYIEKNSLTQNWIAGGQIWVDDFKVTTMFVDQVISTKEVWTGSALVNSERLTTGMVSQTSIIATKEVWENGQWVNSHRTINNDNPSLSLSETIEQDWDGTQWVNLSRFERVVTQIDPETITTETIDQVWENQMWQNVSRTFEEELTENVYQIQMFSWVNDQWNVTSRNISTYANLIDHSITETYDSSLDQWTPTNQFFRVFDGMQTMVTTYQNYDSVWVNDYRITDVQFAILNNNNNNSETILFSVFPNPSSDFVNVSASQSIRSYELFSLDGKIVKSGTPNNDEFSIDISTLGRGVYLLNTDGKTTRIIKN